MKKVVIIGAGIGGLNAANLLAERGHPGNPIEIHTTPRGDTPGVPGKGDNFERGTLGLGASRQGF